MRILMLNYEFPPLGGGGGIVSYSLSRELVKLGHRVDVVTMGFGNLKNFEVIDGINIYRISCLRKKKEICHTYEMASFITMALPKLLKLIRNNKYDVNHTHFIIPTGILSLIIKKITGLPYIITIHGSDVPGYNPHRFKLTHKFTKPIWNAIVKNSSIVTSPTNDLKNLFLRNKVYRKVSIIPNGFCLDKFTFQKKKKKILLISRLFERKGFQYFLEAVKNMDLDYEINIVGDGPYKNELEKRAKLCNSKINFLGWLNNNSREIKNLYETSSIFVFPSEAENFPIVLLEAMAAGMAIITTNVGGCPEVVGDTALLIKPRNSQDIKEKLEILMNDENLVCGLGIKAKKRLENCFSWEKITKEFLSIYNSV